MIEDAGEPGFAEASQGVFAHGKWQYQPGGYRVPQQEVWIGAYPRISYDKFPAMVDRVKWEQPENVQLLICDENHSRFYLGWGKMPLSYNEALDEE